jgi:hypothetical protein
MVLDWKKVLLIVTIVLVFAALSVAKVLPESAVTAGVGAILGWVSGLFTPTPKNKTLIVESTDNVN